MTTPESRTVEQRFADLLHETLLHNERGGVDDDLAKMACLQFGPEQSRCLSKARSILAAAKEHGLVIGPDTDDPEGDPEYMCPNCVTPWKCNGPHLLEGRTNPEPESRR